MKFKRAGYIIAIVLLMVIGFGYLGITYSRYVSSGSGSANVNVAKWSVALKDGTQELTNSFNITFKTTSTNSGNVAANKFAPGTSGNAKLILDLTGTEVGVDYNMVVDMLAFEQQIGTSGITLTALDNNNTPVVFGKDVYIPLVGNQKFTSSNGIFEFKFNLSWDNASDANNLSDTNLALNINNLKIFINMKIKQHIGGEHAEEENKKTTSLISYSESTETKNRLVQSTQYTFNEQDVLHDNPERGFYSSSTITLGESGLISPASVDGVVTKSGTSSMLYLKVDISAFSGYMNASHVDKRLTSAAISALESVLEKIKQNNNTIILRFVYDNAATGIIPGKTKVEPEQETLLSHISDLSDTFKRYSKTINVIQIGFYGLWGECFYNTDVLSHHEYYTQTVSALLNATQGTEITIAVRTVEYYTWFKQIELANINNPENITISADDAYRVGIFNDAYGASATDLGTYQNREKETNWLSTQSSHTFYGGEAIVDATKENGVGEFNTSSFFIPEAFKLHTSYLNWEWNQTLHKGWASEIYTGSDIVYKGKYALTFIENHLGYRFVLKDVRTYKTALSGGVLPIDITMANVGFGNLIKSKQTDIVITNSLGDVVQTVSNVDFNAKDFISQTTIKKSINLNLTTLTSGEYKIYLRLSSGETLSNGKYYSAIRFANSNVYNADLQANYIGKFNV